jgi:DNA-binding beta-propeller fold protein YncE
LAASTRRRTQAGPALTRLLSISAALVLALAFAPPASATSYRFDFRFGGFGTAPGQFSQPQALAIDPASGTVFVADTTNNRVQALTPTGAVLPWAAPASALSSPTGIGVSPVGSHDVYVADTNNNRVVQYDQQGNQLGVITLNGLGTGNLQLPRGIDFDAAGNLYVADTGSSHRINIYSAAGAPQRAIGGNGFFRFLADVAVAPDGTIYAADRNADQIVHFSAAGTELGRWGSLGAGNGQFQGPDDVEADPDGNVIVTDNGNHRVQVFSATGAFETKFGSLGPDPGQFQDPTGLAVSPIGKREVYVADGNNCCAFVSTWQALPDPVLGRAMDIQVDTGTVLFKPKGSKKFKRLTKVTLVKNGTIIDARRGTVSISSVLPDGTVQSADFFKGIFKATTKRSGLTTANLVGGAFNRCPKPRSSKKSKPVRQLWANGKGKFKTQGRYLSAAVRGTAWQTIDTCSGSTVKVTEGSVTVRDFLLKRTVIVNAGGFYTVTAPHA